MFSLYSARHSQYVVAAKVGVFARGELVEEGAFHFSKGPKHPLLLPLVPATAARQAARKKNA